MARSVPQSDPLVTPIGQPFVPYRGGDASDLGATVGGGGKMDEQDILQQLLELEKERFKGSQEEWNKYRDTMEALITGGRDALQTSGLIASGEQQGYVDEYQDAYKDLFGNPITASPYAGDYESQAAKARGDEWALGQSRETLKDLRERSQQGLTPIERLQMEVARRDQESQQRASREAALRDMRARGFGGSGQEMVALLGTQQETANRRALENAAAMANAQQRSDRALQMAGGLGLDINQQTFGQEFSRGQQADKAAEANRQFKLDWDRHRVKTEMENRGQTWGAQGDVTGAQTDLSNRRYGWNIAPSVWATESTGSYMNPKAPDTSGTREALSTILGYKQAERAAAEARNANRQRGFITGIEGSPI